MNRSKIISLLCISLYLLVMLYLLGSCSPAQRLNTFKARHPSLFITDTVTTQINHLIEPSNVDTVFSVKILKKDTIIYLTNERVKQTFELRDSLIYLNCEQFSDTLKVNQLTISNSDMARPNSWSNFLKSDRLLLLLAVLVFLVHSFIRKRQ